MKKIRDRVIPQKCNCANQMSVTLVLPLFLLAGYPSVIFRQLFDRSVMESKQ